MEITVTLSANAGVAICWDGHRIWVDALHEHRRQGFSAVDAPLQKRMLKNDAFSDPDLICYTHCHDDHFSRELTQTANTLWPRAKLLLPECFFENQILVSGEAFVHREEDLTLRFIRLPHEGAAYAQTVHYGILISASGKNILIPGDCQTASPTLAEVIRNTKIDLTLLDFPWFTLEKGRTFIRQIMKPAHVLIYHLPFVQDDCFGYRRAAERAVQKESAMDVSLLYEPLQQINIEI